MTRIAIVNRFFPPDPAITGHSARELADFLRRRLPEANIRIYATQAKYGGGQINQMESPELQHDVRRLRSWYSGKQKFLRLAASLHDGFRLTWAATRKTDVVISLTDPPLLGLWMGLLTRLRRTRWVEWTMDLYPEAFAAAQYVTGSHPFFLGLRFAVRCLSPDQYICLGPQQHTFIQTTRRLARPAFILPCGISDVKPGPLPTWRAKHAGKTILAYAGNLGEAHSVEIIEQLVARADRRRLTFLLAPYGSKAPLLRKRLAYVSDIEWRDHVSPYDLAHADVHIASLTSRWTHICVPSKAVSAVCMGRPVIFAGVPEADNWTMLQEASWLIPEGPDHTHSPVDVDRVLAAVADRTAVEDKSRAARQLRDQLLSRRKDTFEQIAQTIESAAGKRERPQHDRS